MPSAESSISVKGLSTLVNKFKKAAKAVKDVDKELEKALLAAGLLVEYAAKKRIQKSPRGGRTYEMYGPRRTHKASAPGESPATDTGVLVNAITTVVNKGKVAAIVKVGANVAPYSLPLEFGTADGKIRPRPFMKPALEEKGAEASAIIAKAVAKILAEGTS